MPPQPPTSRLIRRDRALAGSPRAAIAWARVYRRHRPDDPRDRWVRIVALAAALLLHLGFLVGVVLGPVYVPPELPGRDGEALQVRLIEPAPRPPPPPSMQRLPPRQRGPRQQAAAAALPAQKRSAPAAVPTPRSRPSAGTAQATAQVPPVPVPDLQPLPLALQPPLVQLDMPPVAKPVPPRFQPEPSRRPTLEGNQPVLPPPSIALPEVPTVAPQVTAPAIAPVASPAPLVPPARATAAPLQPIAVLPLAPLQPLPSAPAPAVDVPIAIAPLQPEPPAALAPMPLPEPSPAAAAAPLQAIPRAAAEPAVVEAPAAPALEPVAAPRPSIAPAVAPPQASTESAAPAEATAASGNASAGASVDRAPDATPQRSDSGQPGVAQGVAKAPLIGADGRIALPASGRGDTAGAAGEGRNAAGKAPGALGTYIQVRPQGDTQVMRHIAPNIGYKPTRFEKAWAPLGESALDSALRHAVEKTTVSHTFHLPYGTRIECVGMPLFPMIMFACGNPDPPAKPLDQKIYDRLNLAPAALVSPKPATAATAVPVSAAPILLDSTVGCATARVAGAPPPPGCAAANTPARRPAPATPGSWAPASDQFH